MNASPEQSFVFCTPFLDEITRAQQACPALKIKQPVQRPKIEDFNRLLGARENIAVTHTTFFNSTPQTVQSIREGGYILILDEVLDVVQQINGKTPNEDTENGYKAEQLLREADFRHLIKTGTISIDSDYRVKWVSGPYGDGLYEQFEKLARMDRLYCVRESALFTVFPPEVLKAFKHVYIMTYMFDCSVLRYYLNRYSLEYDSASIESDGSSAYQLCEYTADMDLSFKARCKELITLYTEREANDWTHNAFSVNWLRSNKGYNSPAMKRARRFMRKFFDGHEVGAKMWTTQKTSKKALQGKGYTEIKRVPNNASREDKARASCFVSCNARATNDYSDRHALAYCYNVYHHPMLRGLFEDNTDRGVAGRARPSYNNRSKPTERGRGRDRNGVRAAALIPANVFYKMVQYKSYLRHFLPARLYPRNKFKNIMIFVGNQHVLILYVLDITYFSFGLTYHRRE